MSISKLFAPKNTRFAIYAGNPGFSGMTICSDFIGYVDAPTLGDAYEAAHFWPLSCS